MHVVYCILHNVTSADGKSVPDLAKSDKVNRFRAPECAGG